MPEEQGNIGDTFSNTTPFRL